MANFIKFFNSQIGLLIFGFILTTIFGTFISDRIQAKNREKDFLLEKERQESSWQREKKYEIIRRKLDDGDKLIEQLSELINSRFFQLQNIYVNISSGNINTAQENWKNYFKTTVQEWNIKLPLIQNKVKRLISTKEAEKLNNYETDYPTLTTPYSIHGKFYILHQKMLEYLQIASKNNKIQSNLIKFKTDSLLRRLDYDTDNYIDNLSEIYLKSTLEFESSIDSLTKK